MMTILLIGAQGQLGRAVQQVAQKKNITLHAFSRDALDITNTNLMRTCFTKLKPNFVINAAAFTAVDLAETNVTAAMQLNAEAPKILADLCAEYDCIFIHPSTDYVFDGSAHHPYTEEDEPNPLSVYGKSKLLGEIGIKSVHKKYIILRISWVFGLDGSNFVKRILCLAQEKKSLSIVSDQIGCPTAAYHIAQVIFKIIDAINAQKIHFGVYHYSDQPALSWYHFALSIISNAKQYASFSLEEIKPIMTCDFRTAATRPLNAQLNCSKIERDYHIQRYHWVDALDYMIKKTYGTFS